MCVNTRNAFAATRGLSLFPLCTGNGGQRCARLGNEEGRDANRRQLDGDENRFERIHRIPEARGIRCTRLLGGK